MAHDFSVRQFNATFQAHLAEPAFDLFKDLPSLLTQLFSQLGRYGLQLADTKFEPGSESLGEVHLRCRFNELRAMLRLYLDRVELTSTPPSVEAATVFAEAAGVVRQYAPPSVYRAYTSTLELHGVPADISAGEFLARFGVVAPQGLGPLETSGAAFYYGAVLNQLASSLIVDLSRVIPSGVFFQTKVIYDARQIDLAEVAEAGREYLARAMGEMGLVLKG